MKNNKGFSLVELIIVIAIMAILVGVMAPQLIKYIEKTNVSSDAQTCDSIRSAITTAMLDPEVVNAANSGVPGDIDKTVSANKDLTDAGTAFDDALKEILGTDISAIKFKSHYDGANVAKDLHVKISNGNSVSVWLEHSDPTGKKSEDASKGKIGAGPEVPAASASTSTP